MNDDANLLLVLALKYAALIGAGIGSIFWLGKAAQRFSALEAKVKAMGEQIEAVQAKHEADNDALVSRIEQQAEKTLDRLEKTSAVLAELALGVAELKAQVKLLLDDRPAPRPRRRTTQD